MKLEEIKKTYRLEEHELDLIAIAMFNAGVFSSAPELSVSAIMSSSDMTKYRVQFQSVVNFVRSQKAKGEESMKNKYIYDRVKHIKPFKGQKEVISKLKYLILPEMLEKGFISDYDGKTVTI